MHRILILVNNFRSAQIIALQETFLKFFQNLRPRTFFNMHFRKIGIYIATKKASSSKSLVALSFMAFNSSVDIVLFSSSNAILQRNKTRKSLPTIIVLLRKLWSPFLPVLKHQYNQLFSSTDHQSALVSGPFHQGNLVMASTFSKISTYHALNSIELHCLLNSCPLSRFVKASVFKILTMDRAFLEKIS